MSIKYFLLVISLFLLSSNENELLKFNANNTNFQCKGRCEILPNGAIALISSAAYVEFNVEGTILNLFIQSDIKTRNYFVLTVNDIYQKRYEIEGDSIHKIEILLPKNDLNKIGIYKATEASSGNIIFYGIEAKSLLPIKKNPYVIEFIGDSITCGALADSTNIPCHKGEYIDQHNAYLSYGPQVAKAVNADFILSSVSGIGMYRNWNDDNMDEPIMPQVYENLYLNTDDSQPFSFSFQPDLISICLGTNDMSDGDGVKNRLPFNSEKYIENYINFIKTLYSYYPKTKIILLNSPMIIDERNNLLVSCLKTIKSNFEHRDIAIYEYDQLYVNGCNYHPGLEDHKAMANQLIPIFKKILEK